VSGFDSDLGACSGAGPVGWCLSAPCTLVYCDHACDHVCCNVDIVWEGHVHAEEGSARQALGAKHAEAVVCVCAACFGVLSRVVMSCVWPVAPLCQHDCRVEQAGRCCVLCHVRTWYTAYDCLCSSVHIRCCCAGWVGLVGPSRLSRCCGGGVIALWLVWCVSLSVLCSVFVVLVFAVATHSYASCWCIHA
jgi:hypothetical protein